MRRDEYRLAWAGIEGWLGAGRRLHEMPTDLFALIPRDEPLMMRPEVEAEIADPRTLFAVNHSGGKDSHAMFIELRKKIPAAKMAVFHADLGEFEWEGATELARDHAAAAGVPFIVAKAVDKAGNKKDLFDLVERRFATRPEVPSWPDEDRRTCTSELKTGPIEREIRRYMKAHGFTRVVNCLGLRAEEGRERRKKPVWHDRANNKNDGLNAAGRRAFNWLPIHDLTTKSVFKIISDAGEKPLWVYANGNERASCKFCVFACGNDLLNAAIADPELYRRYRELEKKTGYTMHGYDRRPLAEIVEEAKRERKVAA